MAAGFTRANVSSLCQVHSVFCGYFLQQKTRPHIVYLDDFHTQKWAKGGFCRCYEFMFTPWLTHRIRMYAIYGNIDHQYTPNVGINLPYIRILWVMKWWMFDQFEPRPMYFCHQKCDIFWEGSSTSSQFDLYLKYHISYSVHFNII